MDLRWLLPFVSIDSKNGNKEYRKKQGGGGGGRGTGGGQVDFSVRCSGVDDQLADAHTVLEHLWNVWTVCINWKWLLYRSCYENDENCQVKYKCTGPVTQFCGGCKLRIRICRARQSGNDQME